MNRVILLGVAALAALIIWSVFCDGEATAKMGCHGEQQMAACSGVSAAVSCRGLRPGQLRRTYRRAWRAERRALRRSLRWHGVVVVGCKG